MLVAATLALLPLALPPVEVFRDRWGVPSIVAPDLEGVLYGLGYMHVLDNGERMALNYKIARGRGAEVLGRGQLLADGFLRGLEIEERAEAAKLDPATERRVQAYVEGANRAIREHRAKLAPWVQPFTRTDVLSLAQFINSAFPLLDLASAILPGVGSNQFAVGPRRSATRHPILSMDPHLEWNGSDGGIVWVEAGLYARDLAFRGVTVPGLPAGLMGHNGHVAISMTNNNPRLVTRYTVELNPDNRQEYRFHGEWRRFKTKQVQLRYLENGELKEQSATTRLTDWGPMVPLRNEAALVEPLGDFRPLVANPSMMRAKNVDEFRRALAGSGLSMWNFVFADTAGNIAYQYNATLRRRDPSFDWTRAVPGGDPRTKLGPPLSLDELPFIKNPGSGVLVNANSAPWLTSVEPVIPKEWPAYVTTYGATSRYEVLSALLRTDPSIDLNEARRYATDTAVPYAQPLIRAVADTGEAGRVLGQWDGHADLESRGTALYAYWLSQNPTIGAMAREVARGAALTPDQLATARTALQAAAAAMKADGLPLDVRWGEVLRMRRGSREIGVSGFGAVVPGAPAAVNPSGPSSPARRMTPKVIAGRGSSFRMVVSLEPGRVRSWSVLPYGNSHDPGSPHYADQMSLFATRRYKETTFGPEAARRAAVQTIRLQR